MEFFYQLNKPNVFKAAICIHKLSNLFDVLLFLKNEIKTEVK